MSIFLASLLWLAVTLGVAYWIEIHVMLKYHGRMIRENLHIQHEHQTLPWTETTVLVSAMAASLVVVGWKPIVPLVGLSVLLLPYSAWVLFNSIVGMFRLRYQLILLTIQMLAFSILAGSLYGVQGADAYAFQHPPGPFAWVAFSLEQVLHIGDVMDALYGYNIRLFDVRAVGVTAKLYVVLFRLIAGLYLSQMLFEALQLLRERRQADGGERRRFRVGADAAVRDMVIVIVALAAVVWAWRAWPVVLFLALMVFNLLILRDLLRWQSFWQSSRLRTLGLYMIGVGALFLVWSISANWLLGRGLPLPSSGAGGWSALFEVAVGNLVRAVDVLDVSNIYDWHFGVPADSGWMVSTWHVFFRFAGACLLLDLAVPFVMVLIPHIFTNRALVSAAKVGGQAGAKALKLLAYKQMIGRAVKRGLNVPAPDPLEALKGHHEWDFRRTSGLAGAILEDLDLSGAVFTGANLRGTTFSRVNLTGADLRGADCMYAEFYEVQLDRANLSGAELYGVKFYLTNTSGAFFNGTGMEVQERPHGQRHW
jgi:hypothetical protein